MKNEIMIFEQNEVEIIELNGEVLFNPRHVGKCLDITNSTVRDHISKMSDKQVKKLTNSNVEGTHFRKLHNTGESFLTESGVYKLIFKSRKPEAEKFQDWVTDVVLPSIRKTGSYSIPKNDINPALVPKWEIEGDAIQRTLAKFRAPEHIIATETAKYILQLGGPDLRNTVGSLPCSQNILEEEIMLEPTELGKHFGLSGKEMNQKLQQLSLQFHNGLEWTPTKEGSKFSQRHAWSRKGKSGYNYKWNLNKIKQLVKTRVPCLF